MYANFLKRIGLGNLLIANKMATLSEEITASYYYN